MSVLEMRQHWPRLVAHSLALIPLLVLGLQAATGTLPFNVWRYLMLQSGLIGMVLLLISFACTPLTTITGWRGWIVMRRPFGVYGFLYALAHLLVYAIYDGALDPALILASAVLWPSG
jgi:methionine sulfoxide reductase heme-binding subunit